MIAYKSSEVYVLLFMDFRVCSESVQSVFGVCLECVQSLFKIEVISSPSASSVQFLDLFICVPICAAYVFILCKISEILMFAVQWSDNACFCRKQLRLSVQFDWWLSGRLCTIFDILILKIILSIYSTCTCAVPYLGLCKMASLNIYRQDFLLVSLQDFWVTHITLLPAVQTSGGIFLGGPFLWLWRFSGAPF